jgi:hypothetical protein
MANRIRSLALVGLLMGGFAMPASAQWYVSPLAGYDIDFEELLVGVSFRFPITSAMIADQPLSIVPSFEFYPAVENATLFLVDVDGVVTIPASGFEPYLGAGVFVRRISIDAGVVNVSDTSVGLNAGGGARFGTANVKPFVEGKLRLGDGSTFTARGGIQIMIGGGGGN